MTGEHGTPDPPKGESSSSPRRDGDSDTASSPIRHAALRIGILGAARIAEQAIVDPSRVTDDRLVAVAVRDPERAKAYADADGVERALGSYADLLADPEVDIVYNPLANGLHGPWNRAAIQAGKHVWELAGGAQMDLGCYSLHLHRFLGNEPRIVGARVGVRAGHPGVDEWLESDVEHADGVTGLAQCNMAAQDWRGTCPVSGSRGRRSARTVKPTLSTLC